jgi:hypothetical protein
MYFAYTEHANPDAHKGVAAETSAFIINKKTNVKSVFTTAFNAQAYATTESLRNSVAFAKV